MPKYEVPGMHAKFTDHFIRVVRKGEGYSTENRETDLLSGLQRSRS